MHPKIKEAQEWINDLNKLAQTAKTENQSYIKERTELIKWLTAQAIENQKGETT